MEYLKKIKDNLAEEENKRRKDSFAFYIVFIVFVLITVFIVHLNLFVLMNIEVEGESMINTLQDGDNLIAIRNADIHRGDIIIINKRTHDTTETGGYYIIKRVIGIGGDKVDIKNGKVYLNGELLNEPYLTEGQITYAADPVTRTCNSLEHKTYQLAYDEIFYLGDNRVNSTDARVNGPCKYSDVMGVVSGFSLRHKETLTGIFKFIKSVNDLFSGAFGCGGN